MLLLNCKEEQDFKICRSVIRAGGIIVYPTDTIYGIGCDPYKERAVEKIFNIKKRDRSKPFPLLTYDIKQVEKVVLLNENGRKLAKFFWPGPLTIVGQIIDNKIPKIVTAGKLSIGMRIPNHLCTLKLLEYCKLLVGTSANISNETPCNTARQVLESKLEGYDAIITDNGELDTSSHEGSTIIDITYRDPKVIREGIIKSDYIYKILSK